MSKVRFLLSTGITRFHRYYEPLRSPRQPSLALARCRLVPIFRFHCWGFPCSVCLPIHACRRHYPDRPNGPKSLVFFRQLRPSPCFGRVGICIDCFEACSAFTHVTTCMFTEPLNGPLHRRLQRLRYLHRRFDYYQVERSSSWVGLSPTEKHRLVTAHQNSSLGRVPLPGVAQVPRRPERPSIRPVFLRRKTWSMSLLFSLPFPYLSKSYPRFLLSK